MAISHADQLRSLFSLRALLTLFATLCALLALTTGPTHAQYELPASGESSTAKSSPAKEDPEIDKRLRYLSTELRCLVCQNQNLADSDADLAVDLRNQIRTQLQDGRSNQEILNYMVDRYGDFVLYRPPFKAQTVVLWIGPFVLLALALFFLFRQIGRRRQHLINEQFPDQDLARARALLKSNDPDKKKASHS